MTELAGRRILLGVGGGVACYRSAELLRLLRKEGAEVRCVMTRSACEFITPLTLESLSGAPVYRELFALTDAHRMGHIELARWADLLVVAPATANLIARLAHGIADDLLTTLALVCERPRLLAPAMNHSMWAAPTTARNVARLCEDGAVVAGPEHGDLACGEQGEGRMRAPARLVDDIRRVLTPPVLRGRRWVVTTGPTWERWDDVRVLTNRASGWLGALIAHEARLHGAEVVVIAGPGAPEFGGVHTVVVESAAEMLEAALCHASGADLFLSAAAVSDYRIAEPLSGKLKRDGCERLTLELQRNPDIVAAVAAMEQGRPTRVVAFAAEDFGRGEDAVLAEGRRKLAGKRVDGIIVNDLRNMGEGAVAPAWWLDAEGGSRRLAGGGKEAFARQITQLLIEEVDGGAD